MNACNFNVFNYQYQWVGGQTGCLHSNYSGENSILGCGSLKAPEVPKYEHREMYRLTVIVTG